MFDYFLIDPNHYVIIHKSSNKRGLDFNKYRHPLYILIMYPLWACEWYAKHSHTDYFKYLSSLVIQTDLK